MLALPALAPWKEQDQLIHIRALLTPLLLLAAPEFTLLVSRSFLFP
jgi:hypothetical protein